MYFNRKNAEQKNWRMIKKGKHFLFGCSLVFAVGAALVAPSVKADTVEAKPDTSSTTEGAKPVVSEENPTYAAPAVEVAPAAVAEEKAEKPVETTQNSKEEAVVATEKAKEADSIKAPEVTVVYDPAALTEEEKAKVVEAVKAANPTATDVQVQADGSVVVTFADGSSANLTATQTIKDGSQVAKPRTNRAARATATRSSEGAQNLDYSNKPNPEGFVKATYEVDNAKNTIHWTVVVNGGRVGNQTSGYSYFTVPKDSVGAPTNWRVLQTDKNGNTMSDRRYWKDNDGTYPMGGAGRMNVYTGSKMTKELTDLYKKIGNPAIKGNEAAAAQQASERSQALYMLTADVAGGIFKNPSWTITFDTPILDKSKPLDYTAGLQGTAGIGGKTNIMAGYADNFIDNASSKFQAVAVKEKYTAKVGGSFNADPATYVTNKAGTPEFPNNYRGATTFAWKDGQAPTATQAGTYTKTVVVTYPAHYNQAPQEVTVTFEVEGETPTPETPKPVTPAGQAPEITSDLSGKASTPADVTVKATAGSTVKLYNKDGVVIGEAVANDQGVATITPTNSLPEGEITATSTPVGGSESAKSAPITVTKTPITESGVNRNGDAYTQLLLSKTHITVYPGDNVDIDVIGAASSYIKRFYPVNPNSVYGLFPDGTYFQTTGSQQHKQLKNKYHGTVHEMQPAGDFVTTFVLESKNGKVVSTPLKITVLESAKKYEPVAGEKVEVADPNKLSEDDKNKIIDSVKTANPSLPASATYGVDEKGNLTITYPDKSTDKIAAAYLVNPTKDTTAPDKPVVNTDLTGKAGTKTPVEVTAEKGSTVALYDKAGNKIGEATAGENGKAKITPTVDIPAGNVTATATDAAGNTSVASDPATATTPAASLVAPTVSIPYSDPAPDKKEIYLYRGEEADVDITFNDDSGKIKFAALKQGGNRPLSTIGGNPDLQDNQFGYTVTAINSETPTPAKIKVTGQVSGLKESQLPKTENDSLDLVTRFATATDTDGKEIKNEATKYVSGTKTITESYKTDPGAVTFVLKAQTKKYDIKTPASADKVTVSDANNVTDKEFEKIKEKVKVEYSQNNPDARLADKKGQEVEDASKVVDKVEKEGNNVVVTYKDGSKDTKPLSEFVNVAPKVELPYSNEANKQIYVYTGENTDLTFKASDNTAVKDMYVRGPGGIGEDNTARYGFTTGKIENSAVTHGDGTVSGNTATIKMTGVTTLTAPNRWTSFVVANDNDNAPSATDFNALDKNPNATQTPGYVQFIVKSQTDKYDIATPAQADKVEVADPNNVTNDDLDKIKEKLKLEYNKNNDDANISKDSPVDKNGKIQSVTKDGNNLVVTYTDGSKDTKPLSEFVTKAKTAPAKPVVNTDLTGKAGTKTPVEVSAEPGSKVELFDKAGTKIGEATADENGKATITPTVDIPAGPVTATATKDGQTSDASDSKEATAATPAKPSKPVVETDLTGKAGTKTPVEVTAEPGSKVELFDKAGTKIGEATADENGKATITPTVDIPAGPVTAKATKDGQTSDASDSKEATAATPAKPSKPVVDTDLTGKAGTKTPVEVTAEPGSKVELFDKAGTKIGEATADENGKATITPTVDIPAGPVTATATKDGQTSDASDSKEATAATPAKPSKPVVDTDLTGKAGTKTPVEVTAEPGSKVELFDKAGTKIGEATADENGKATITPTVDIPAGPVTAKATKDGQTSDASDSKEATAATPAKPSKPVVETDLTGKAGTKTPVEVTAEPGSKVELFDKAGTKIGEATADENGKATITPTVDIPAGPVTATATKDGQTSDASDSKEATAATPAKPSKPVVETDLTGKAGTKTPVEVTAEPGTKVELFDKAGTKIGEATADENGKATITPTVDIPAGPVTAKATKDGQTSDASDSKEATAATPAKPSKPVVETDLTGKAGTKTPVEVTAEPGTKVELFDKAGTKIGEATADENGKATITPTVDIPAGPVTATATKDGQTSDASDSKEATAATPAKPSKPVVDTDLTGKAGTKTPVEVTAEPGSKVELFDKAGTKIGEATADENGKATITPTVDIPAGPVTATATKDGQTSDASDSKEATAATPAKPSKPVVETDLTGKAGTKTPVEVTAEPGSKVELFDKAGTKIGEATADENGKATITPTVDIPAGPVTATATKDGQTSDASDSKEATAATPAKPSKPVVETDLTGKAGTKTPVEVTAEPGTKVELFDKAGTKIGEATADENGKATITPTVDIPAGPVTAKATKDGQTSDASDSKEATAATPAKPSKPVVETDLTGKAGTKTPVEVTAEPGTKVELFDKAGTKIGEATADENGKATITPTVDIPAGPVTAKATKDGQTSDASDSKEATAATPATDADKNTPVAKDQTVKPGDKPSAKDSIGNVAELPSGTTFEFKEPVDTTTPGEKSPVVVVTYPDGSKDEVPVKVTVKDPDKTSDADNNTPTAKDQTVKQGEKPSAKDSIGNFDKLPKGTTAEFKTPVDTTTPGEKSPVVVVTYPDKSTDEVPVKVTVKEPTDADKNTPVAKEQNVNKGETPNAKDSIGNVGDLPEGTKFEFKTPVDTTTPGEKDATVVVTYPDGSKDEVPVKVTVPTDADKNTPVAKDQTVKPGDKPSAKDSIGNVGDLPEGTKFEFKTPVDTTTPGDKSPVVVVTYPDGSQDEVPVKVTVKDPEKTSDAENNTPVAKEQNVNKGETPNAKDSIGNVGDLPEGTKFEFKTPVDTTTPGEKDATVVVTYPDGSKDEVPVKVTVPTDADKNTPVAKDQTVKPGDKPSAKDSIGNVGDLPEGTKFEFKTPVDTTKPGEKDATVVVTYPDGSKDEVPVKVTVKDPEKTSDAENNTPVAKEQNVNKGETPNAKDSIGNVGDLPEGTKFEFKTPVDTTTPGEKDATVVVTYPDGSKDEVPVKVTVPTDADKNTPVAKDQTVKPGDKPSAKDSIGNVGDLPEGTKFEFKTPVDTTTPGDKAPTVVVTYPDGSTEEVPVKVTVKDPEKTSDAENNTPVAKEQNVNKGETPNAKDSIGNVGDLPEGTKFEFKTPVDTTTPGDKSPVVVVTYPDGSQDEVPVKVTVKDPEKTSDAENNTPVAKEQNVNKGETPNAKDSIGNVGDLPEGTKFEFKTPVDTTTPGEKDATVVVTYPDGSKDEVPVKVTVPTDADKNTPVAKDQTVKPGDKPSAKDSIGNVGDLPEGTKFEFKTPVDTTTPGDKAPTVVVTYPDGSTEEVPVKVTVKDPSAPATDAEKNTPVAKDQTVKPGDKPNAKDSIGNVGDLPKGTTVEFKTPVDTTTPGEKDATVVVTYPDGSKDEVPVKVTVKEPTDAEKNTPVAKDQTVKPGEKPKAEDSIDNLKDLPKGTTVAFKDPVDTTTPGDKAPTVVVTYPDGSTEEVPVKVTVKDPSAPATDAEKNTPVAKDQTVKPGDKPNAKDSIGNVGDLPKGTTVEFKTPVDTTTPGEKDATVVVTYPDGSKDEVPVKVTVEEPTNKVVKDPTVTPVVDPNNLTDAEKAKVADEVKKANPTASKVEVGNDGTATVTYPDGTSAVIPADKTVKKSDDKAVKDPAVTPVVDPSNLTDAEKAKVADEVKKANPTASKVEVGNDGVATVTYPDGTSAVIPADKTVKKSDDKAVKDPAVTPVVDPSNLTDAEKAKVADEVKKANPTASKVEVGNDGTATVTYPDGTSAVIPADKTVKKSDDKAVKDPVVTPVVDPSNLTDAEKAKVADEVKKANPTASKVEVGNDGTATVTYPDGTTAVIPADKTVKKSDDKVVKDPAVTPVVDPSNLTDAEKAKVADEVKKANPTASKVEVGNDGTATVTYPDGTTAVIPADKTVKKSDDKVVKDPAVTPVVDPSNLTDAEKVKVADEVKKANPTASKVEVGNDGTATVTYPDGTTAVIPADKTVKKSDDKGTKDPAVTPVVDPSNLTDAEKVKVADEVKKANPTVSKVEVGNDGTATVTYPDGTSAVIPADKTVKKSDDKVVKDPAVTPVVDPSNLTDAEKAKVADEVKKANPTASKVEVGNDGTATVTYPDGTTAVIPADKTVKKSDDKVVKDPAVTPVVNPSNLTDAEKAKVTDEVKKANPTASKVEVGNDGTATVTYPDGTSAVIPADKTVKKSDDKVVKDPAVTPVVDPSNLTDAEKAKVADEVKKANPTASKVEVGNDGTATVTYPDGTTAVIPADKTVKKSDDKVVKDPAVTPVVNPSNLTDAEKAKVTDEVKKANPTASKVEVGNDGTATVTYPDGTSAVIPADKTVKKSDDKAVKDPAVTPVVDPSNLTDAEKAKVADEVKKANPTASKVEVGNDGTATVTYPDGTSAVIPADKTVKKSDDKVVKDPAVTPVVDPSNLTDAEKAKVADEVKKANPTASKVEVGNDGTATVTFPDGSVAVLTPAKTVKEADSNGVKTPAITPVVTPSALTDAEKAKVADEVKKANPTASKVEVGNDGTATVTFPDGSVAVLTPAKTVKEADSNGVKTPAITPVVNPSDLTDAEKAKVAEEVKKANPTATDIKVNNDGSVVVTFPDGSVAVIASENAVKEATKESAANQSAKKAGAKELPNTGTEQSNASLGLALLAAATGGLLFAKKRKEEE